MQAGGVALIPMDVGYAGIGSCQDALMRFFHAKGRGAHKRNAMLGNLDLHDELHLLDDDFRSMEVVRIGSCYEVIADVLQRNFGVELPADPGLEALPSGHPREAQRRYA
ncbi:hypothetical protein [Falsiroseomonas tokyonensis]|uniref:hypothetical protein n=1 Tax=Falsiroseomonas tokyonensis TaxID=430521 RepID=UPI001C20B12C|nr:hypothetical protein [Falsiroseomonas tokyonensis]